MKRSDANRARSTRRGFLTRMGAAAAAAAAAPYFVRPSAMGLGATVAPSERITVGIIGAGARMGGIAGELGHRKDAQRVAVCDVYAPSRERMRRAMKLKPADSYNDFRELTARDDIDAVAIAVPDHWHVLTALWAIRAGKDVYLEKPLSNTIAEGRALADAVKRYGAVFQHGTQLRSIGGVRLACELVRNGRIGELKVVKVGSPPGGATGHHPPQPVPEGLDYDLWLGPAPWAPFTRSRVFGHGWYFISDYSQAGWVAGHAVHDMDLAHWGMGTELTGPVSVEGRGVFPKDGLYDTVTTYRLEYEYPGGLRVILADTSKHAHGVRFEGTKGWVFTRYDCLAEPRSLIRSVIGPDETHLYRSPGHVRNWLDCIKTRRPTIAPAEVAHRSCSASLIGGIALKLQRKLRWDAKAERFIDDDEANKLLHYAMRPPWRL